MFAVDEPLEDYLPRPAPLFRPSRIVLAKGSNRTQSRRRLAERICAAYPDAEVVEAFGTPHNRVDLGETDPLRLHDRGKQTLVLGEHRSAVRFSEEGGNACPNYWHFSPYGFCPYGCHYCYLAGTPGVWFSPTVKIFLNLAEILAEVDRTATQLGRSDRLLSGQASRRARLGAAQRLRADDDSVLRPAPVCPHGRPDKKRRCREPAGPRSRRPDDPLVDGQRPGSHTAVSRRTRRMSWPGSNAMRQCAEAGYPVRAVVMPIIPVADWQETYGRFIATLLESVPLSRITLGSICSYPQAQRLMELKLGKQNAISTLLDRGPAKSDDGRLRFSRSTREEVYRYLVECIRRQRPDLEIGLCLEDEAMFASLGLQKEYGTLQLRALRK